MALALNTTLLLNLVSLLGLASSCCSLSDAGNGGLTIVSRGGGKGREGEGRGGESMGEHGRWETD